MGKLWLRGFYDAAKFAELASSIWPRSSFHHILLFYPSPYVEKKVLPGLWSHTVSEPRQLFGGTLYQDTLVVPTLYILSLGLKSLLCKVGGLLCSTLRFFWQ